MICQFMLLIATALFLFFSGCANGHGRPGLGFLLLAFAMASYGGFEWVRP